MRFYEGLLLISIALQALVVVGGRPRGLVGPLIGFPIAAAAVQFVLEGARWQLVPAWLLLAILSMFLLRVRLKPGNPKPTPLWRRALLAAALAPVFTVAVILPAAVPVFQLPAPAGPYPIGTTNIYVADPDRAEIYTQDPDDIRELMVQVWYPAEGTEGLTPDRYWPTAARRSRLMADSWQMPGFLFQHLALVKTHSFAGAPVATALGMRPVVVFSHGLTQGYPGQNTPLFEELASNGTVVFSIAHTYETLAVEMPDGRLLPWDKDLEASFVENIRAFKPIHQKLLVDYEGRPLPSDGLRGLFDLTPVISRSMAVWAADISSVIDEIERMSVENQTEGLGVILDPSKMAAAGMSFGGTASAQAAFSDERIRAVVNLDGFHYGDALLGKRVSVPYLLFGSNVSQRWRNNYVLEDGPSTSYWVVLAEAKHFDFSDFVFFGDVFRWLRALGPIGEARMPGLISAFVVPFLDGVFENQGPADLDSLTEKWPEAQVTKFPLSESDDSLFQP